MQVTNHYYARCQKCNYKSLDKNKLKFKVKTNKCIVCGNEFQVSGIQSARKCCDDICIKINHLKTQRKAGLKYLSKNEHKRYARRRVSWMIEKGEFKKANEHKCYECDEQAQDYHHWKGYDKEHQIDVIPLCKKCHKKYDTN